MLQIQPRLKAKKLYDEAGGYKGGTLTIAVNGDGWTQAVG